MNIYLYNTLTRKKEIFVPARHLPKGDKLIKKAGLYTCGPTVYWYAHIGNLRTYIFEDILRRVFEYNGYKVRHVMNITDVGHLTSDADIGEDKVEMEAKKEGKTAWQIAQFYTDAFKKNLKSLNILEPTIWCKATGHIKEMVDLIKALEKKGVTYQLEDGIYFDTSKINDYGKLAGLKAEKLKAGARVEMVAGKKNPTDFALWKFSPENVQRQMEWNSPWTPPGSRDKVKGFPGWHIECSAMSLKYLTNAFRNNKFYGERSRTIDIHCGGIDHIPIHHTNEIAQSETATNKKFVNYWLHGEFLILDKGKMAKSERRIIKITDLVEKGFNPLAFRYLCLTAHYRSKLFFSWKSLEAAQNALNHLYDFFFSLDSPASKNDAAKYEQKFLTAINDDLNAPGALSIVWQVIKNKNLSSGTKKTLLLKFDKVLGLGLKEIKKRKIPAEILRLTKLRERARQTKDWAKADELRRRIEKKGFRIEDEPKGPKISYKD